MNRLEAKSGAFLLFDESNSGSAITRAVLAQNDYPRVGKYIPSFSG
jgi:hypothetical protein